MRKFFLFFALSLAAAVTAVNPDKTLLIVDGEPITVGEFQYIYGKNNSDDVLDRKALNEYKDMFIDFKLKVAEAQRQGLDTTMSFITELQGYRDQLARPYLTSTYARDSLLQQAYQRRLVDLDVWHIAIKAPADAAPEDTLVAYNKIWEAYKRIKGSAEVVQGKGKQRNVRHYNAPKPFELVADQLSDDPSVKENHGHIGWVGVFQMYYIFENVCYNTPVGEISEPFRSPYGYHIVRIAGKRQDPGEFHIAHIMLVTPRAHEDDSAADKAQIDSLDQVAKQRIDSLYQRLNAGDKFEDLVQKYSDDKSSAYRGGDLGLVGTGVIPEFEKALIELPEGKEFTAPVRSRYGWHILRLLKHRNWGSFKEERKTIAERLERSDRQAFITKFFADSLRNIYAMQGNDSVTDKMLIDRYKSELETRFPEFRNIIREYHDGILLFDISSREVWDKATQDTLGLKAFFEQHKNDYRWQNKHFKGRMIYCKDKQTLKLAQTMAKNAPIDSLESYLMSRLNDSILYVRVHKVLVDVEDSAQAGYDMLQKTVFKKTLADGAKYLGKTANDNRGHYSAEGYPFVIVVGKVVNNPEAYTDMRGPVTNDYQNYLEKAWIERLRKEHSWYLDQHVWDSLTK